MLHSFSQNFEKGDIMVLGVNSNNSCQSGVDLIYLVFFKDILTNTAFLISDNRWTGSNFSTSEGVMLVKRTGGTLTAGTIVKIDINNSGAGTSPGWTITKANTGNPFNLATGADQFLIWQGTWNDSGAITGSFKLAYNTKRDWNANPDSNNSSLPNDLTCFHISSPLSNLYYRYYQGLTDVISQGEWLVRILNFNNWKNDLTNNTTGCQNFNAFFDSFPTNIPILTSIPEQEICSGEALDDLEVVDESNVVEYQWYRNTSASTAGATPVGTNSFSYTPSNTLAGTYYYYCEMTIDLPLNGTSNTSDCTFTSNYFKVTINPQPGTSPILATP